ncbi:hypothetical protein LO772_02985 [Yinghuangia sp. ASG 101]|uniref:hypothetical protein n=1 Tax=Yinghuangia sp. ASG 101 TaxID=2896848 RepID=UPI001E3BB2D1|nr:hypothetical protein [Yinghuangia sp. ASG 101]UGQ12597.1 hypothetical protein LO772_02985 [Yinghuangia sp. ASG 101]
MPQARPDATELKEQYAAQVTADLERNTREQERIGAEVAALHEQLLALQQDQTLLEGMRQAIGAPLPAGSGKTGGTAAARKSAAAPETGRRRKAAAAPRGKAKTAAKRSTGQPTLGELIHAHLAARSEPRSTAEITESLVQAHPQRGIKNKVVRTTIEGLVARGRVERRKQGSSVYYTTTEQSGTAAGTQDTKAS